MMGDSSACLMHQPFCYASGFSNEANEGNPIDALGESVSFGRFMTESLAWDKWSSFSNNRYVEEAEKFSRPGSVAQKKAFFEAHYKKIAAQKAAKALLEQANNAAQTTQEHEEEVVDGTHTSPKSKIADEENGKVLKSEPDSMLGDNGYNSNFHNQLDDVDYRKKLGCKIGGTTAPVDTAEMAKGSISKKEVLKSRSNNKVPASSFTLLEVIGTSKFTSTPIKSTAPGFPNEDNIADSITNKPAASSSADHKKRSKAKSLRASLNFAPIRGINKLTASVMRKFDSAKVGAAKATKSEVQEHSSSLAQSTEQKRDNMTSPIVSSPFTMRTEERAASCGKKKLEDMLNDKEAQNMQQTKLKDKAKKRIRKLRPSFCFKAMPLPESYSEREASKRDIDKDQPTQPELAKQGRRPIPGIVKSKTSFSEPSLDNNGIKNFQGKNGSTLTLSLTSNSTMNMIITHENTSPNIQHGKS